MAPAAAQAGTPLVRRAGGQDDRALGKSLERSQRSLLLISAVNSAAAIAAVCRGKKMSATAAAVTIWWRSSKPSGADPCSCCKLIVGQWLMVLALSALTGGKGDRTAD